MVQAQPNTVLYLPLSRNVEGNMPLLQTYTLQILSPDTYPTGTTSAVSLNLSVLSFSTGDAPTAATYVTFIDPATGLPTNSVSFNSAGQVRTVTVRVAVPLLGLPGGVTSATFAYKVTTAGWPGGITPADGGSFINAVASIDPSGDPNRLPPVVTINTPTDGQVFTVTSFPATIPVAFLATARTGFGITGVDATINSSPIVIVAADITANADSTSVTVSKNITVAAPGSYSLRANAHNSVGDATDLNSFSVVVNAAPPVAEITSPANGTSYTIRAGESGVSVPISFRGVSTTANVVGFNVTLDGALWTIYTTSTLGQPIVTGSSTLTYLTGGVHPLTVQAIDSNGALSPVVSTTFTINYIAPTPVATVALTNGTSYQIATGATSVPSIPFTITSTADNNFNIDTVTATLNGNPVSIATHSPALGSAGFIASGGALANVSAGNHVLTVRCGSVGILSQPVSINFTVNAPLPLPTVVINTPAAGSTYTLSGASLNIPLTFTGTSNATGGVITQLTAMLNSTNLTVTPTNLNQRVATGAATMTVTAAGTYTITVTARDFVGTATATRTFTVTSGTPRAVCGSVFFDADADAYEDCPEFGLSGVTVRILNSANAVVGTTTTNACGNYSFSGIYPGTYAVTVTPLTGFRVTTVATRSITIAGSNVSVAGFGLGLDFTALRTMTANGFTIGYWKNNLDKAISGKTNGIQVPASTLSSYTCKIGDLALSPYDNISMKTASSTMGSSSSAPKDLLSKQLIASEYNYMNCAYLNGNKTLTYCFIFWGETVLKSYTSYSSTYLNYAKNWFDAYNNSHGGVVAGPAAP